MRDNPCPCGSTKTYANCCAPFHDGKELPRNALLLMRSRYSAYALNLAEYIIATTHPASPGFHENQEKWKHDISQFSKHSVFEQLEVIDFQERGKVASVTFVAHILQNKKDVTFTEKSYFEKVRGKWFYRTGQLMEGKAPNLMTVRQMRLLPLAYYGNPILRKVTDNISEITETTRELVSEMIDTMDSCDGLGLAAPQVHYSIQLFVIRVPIEEDGNLVDLGEPVAFLNPKIITKSTETWKAPEGCLSIPSVQAEITRPKEITIEYTNIEGKRVQETCSGWKARVIQHEYDHINGVLFIDHLTDEEKKSLEPFLERLHRRIHDGTEL